MNNATRHFAPVLSAMALALTSFPMLAQDIVIDSGSNETVISRLTAAPAQQQLVCSNAADGTLGPCAGAISEPVLITIYKRDASFDGDRVLFVNGTHEACVGTTIACQSNPGGYVVPAGKILLIHEISMTGRILAGSQPATASGTLQYRLVMSGDGGDIFLGNMDLVSPGLNIWEKGRSVKMTVPTGFTVTGKVEWSDFGGTDAEGTLFINGSLVSANP